MQQHIILAALRMHTSKKRNKNYKKEEKFRYNDLFLKIVVLTPPMQHHKSSFYKNVSKEGTVHKHHCRPIIDHVTLKKVLALKKNTFNKTIVRHNQLIFICDTHFHSLG
jgi:hypothetical protein